MSNEDQTGQRWAWMRRWLRGALVAAFVVGLGLGATRPAEARTPQQLTFVEPDGAIAVGRMNSDGSFYLIDTKGRWLLGKVYDNNSFVAVNQSGARAVGIVGANGALVITNDGRGNTGVGVTTNVPTNSGNGQVLTMRLPDGSTATGVRQPNGDFTISANGITVHGHVNPDGTFWMTNGQGVRLTGRVQPDGSVAVDGIGTISPGMAAPSPLPVMPPAPTPQWAAPSAAIAIEHTLVNQTHVSATVTFTTLGGRFLGRETVGAGATVRGSLVGVSSDTRIHVRAEFTDGDVLEGETAASSRITYTERPR